MARRRPTSSSPVGLVLGLCMRLPWWLLVLLGVLGAPLIRSRMDDHTTALTGMGSFQLNLGMVLAWAWLSLWLMMALGSFWRHRKRRRLLSMHTSLESLRAMSWQDFERVVGEAYRQQGYSVKETGLGGADGGVDLVLTRRGSTTLVQCKRWTSRSIGVPVVREMWGLAHHHGARGAKIVTVGKFTSASQDFSKGKDLELVDGPALVALIGAGIGRPPASSARSASSAPVRVGVLLSSPSCPVCRTTMVKRVSRRDGSGFWGCPSFPSCAGTRPLDRPDR